MPYSSENSPDTVVLFDLDDTLYKEIEFLKLGYYAVAAWLQSEYGLCENPCNRMFETYRRGGNVFVELNESCRLNVPISDYLSVYRGHKPDIVLPTPTRILLDTLISRKCILGIITDGRSITQRNKIAALGLERYVSSDHMLISEEFGCEKPCPDNYRYFELKYPGCRFCYVGDNLQKDFTAPNKLGWKTICLLDNGQNIHKQHFEQTDTGALPQIKIRSLDQIIEYL